MNEPGDINDPDNNPAEQVWAFRFNPSWSRTHISVGFSTFLHNIVARQLHGAPLIS